LVATGLRKHGRKKGAEYAQRLFCCIFEELFRGAKSDMPEKTESVGSSNEAPWRGPVCRGVRGATTTTANTREAILEATRELMQALIAANGIRRVDVASAFFTTTADLNAEYPALAARQIGWHEVALMCGHEMAIPNGLPMCIRVMVHWNTIRSQSEIHHIYLRGATNLRPDRGIEMPELIQLLEKQIEE
jgi:chorismate mutase